MTIYVFASEYMYILESVDMNTDMGDGYNKKLEMLTREILKSRILGQCHMTV